MQPQTGEKMKKVFSRLNALKAGQSCAEFASFCGIPQQTMYNYCSEIRPPNLEAILKICTTNRVSADWLLGLSDDRRGGTPSGADAVLSDLQKKIHDLEVENSALQKALSLVGGRRAPVAKTGGSPAIKTA